MSADDKFKLTNQIESVAKQSRWAIYISFNKCPLPLIDTNQIHFT